jgi:hypothetical protein
LGGKMFDFGDARMRVPVRRAREFMERMKAEERRIRRAVVDMFLIVGRFGGGAVVLGGLLLVSGLELE